MSVQPRLCTARPVLCTARQYIFMTSSRSEPELRQLDLCGEAVGSSVDPATFAEISGSYHSQAPHHVKVPPCPLSPSDGREGSMAYEVGRSSLSPFPPIRQLLPRSHCGLTSLAPCNPTLTSLSCTSFFSPYHGCSLPALVCSARRAIMNKRGSSESQSAPSSTRSRPMTTSLVPSSTAWFN